MLKLASKTLFRPMFIRPMTFSSLVTNKFVFQCVTKESLVIASALDSMIKYDMSVKEIFDELQNFLSLNNDIYIKCSLIKYTVDNKKKCNLDNGTCKIISQDGIKFLIDYDTACISEYIKNNMILPYRTIQLKYDQHITKSIVGFLKNDVDEMYKYNKYNNSYNPHYNDLMDAIHKLGIPYIKEYIIKF